MKKLIFLILSISMIFAASNEDINKKLDLLINKINELEKKVDLKDKEIKKLKKELKKQEITTQNEFAIKSCDKIKVVSLKYVYEDDFMPYYKLTIVLKNNYPKDIKFIRGSLFAEDKDRVKILQDYISRDVNFKKNSTIVIKKTHMIDNDLEKYLKDEDPEELYIYFSPTRIEFKDGKVLECD